MTNYFFPPTLRLSEEIGFEDHGSAILLLIRERRARNWKDLCRLFRFAPLANHSGHYALRSALNELIRAGLLESKNGMAGPYRISPKLEEMLGALEISLVEAANLTPNEGMAVRPLFGPRPELVGTAHIFVLMPFAKPFDATYAAIRSVGARMKLGVSRADEIYSTRAVMEDVWSGICNSGVVVADCTGRNPNVFYEIGIAHAVGRDVILLTQDVAAIPFDIGHMRHIQYRPTAAGLKKLQADLRKTLVSIRADGWDA